MQKRLFDLNIEKILEDWDVCHAIREVIANAIDEQILTATENIKIFKDREGKWHIKDFGRGIRYEHFTQKENEEKLKHPHVIGKFGIGIKDALATIDRMGVKVIIMSKHCSITLDKTTKHGFDDIVTLHAYVMPPTNPEMIGTEFVLDGVSDTDIEEAKALFWIFSRERIIEETNYGTVLEKKGDIARIYVNGVRVSKEENFLFTYNITSLTKQIRQALNRERTNVGRSAYSGRVKSILLSCTGKEIANTLVRDLEKFSSGVMHDELRWLDVQEHAVKILNATEKVLFLTPQELLTEHNMVEEANESGLKIITIPDNLKDRVHGQNDISGNPIRDLGQFFTEYHDSFTFSFVDPRLLNRKERKIYRMTNKVFKLIGGKPPIVEKVRISDTMRRELGVLYETKGLWDLNERTIIIKRSELSSLRSYASFLLHETAHAISNAPDSSRAFEMKLTELLGRITSSTLKMR